MLVEYSVAEVGPWILKSAIPIRFVTNDTVQFRRIPDVLGEDDMWQRIPFGIGIWAHRRVGKVVDDIDRNDEPIRGGDGLSTADLK